MDPELRHEALQVGTHRVRGQLQPLCDLLPPSPLDQVEQDLPLARCESREELIAAIAVLLVLDQQAQHLAKLPGWQPGLTMYDAADNAKKVIDRLILPHPSGHTGADRGHDPLGIRSRAEHDHARRVFTLCHLGAEGDARVIWQLSVEQDDIGCSPGQGATSQLRRLGLSRYHQVLLSLQPDRQSIMKGALLVNNEHVDFWRHRSRDIRQLRRPYPFCSTDPLRDQAIGAPGRSEGS